MRQSSLIEGFTLAIITFGIFGQTAATAASLTPVKFDTPARDYAQVSAANLVSYGDFNGDGILDVVTIENNVTQQGEVRLGNGNGTFKPGIVFYPGYYNSTVATGDFNRDGKLDLIVGSFVLLGKGDGTFQPPVNIGLHFDPNSIAVADLNGDGNLDVAAGAGGLNVFTVLGNGDGTFQAPQTIAFAQSETNAIAIADVNDDGIPDLLGVAGVDTTRPGTFNVALGNGDGTFKVPTAFQVGDYPTHLAIADFNNDGYLDVVVGDGTSQLSGSLLTVLLGDGTGSFAPGVTSAAVDCLGNIAAGDFNHDGKMDVVVGCPANSTGGIEVYLGNGDGTFEAPLQTAVFYGGPVAVADFNKDGNLDVVSGNSNPDVSVLLGEGNGLFESAPHFAHPTPASNLAIGDVTGDGRPDLITINQSGAIETLPGNGNSSFASPVFSSSIKGAGTLVLADFNGDGKQDAAAIKLVASVPAVFLQLSGGGGSFESPTTISTSSFPVSLAVGDFNHDGKADLVYGNYRSDSVSIRLGNGDGTFQPALTASTGTSEPLTLAVADLNRDGKLDLVIGDTLDSSISVLLGNADGTFQPALPLTLANTYTGLIALGDLNGDGFPDLAFQSNAEVTVMLGNGNGTFQPRANYSVGQYLMSLNLADMNLDGHLDLVALTQGNNVVVLPGYGDGAFQALTDGTVYFGTSNSPFSLVVGDVNGDGKPDAIAETLTDISVFTNETN